MNKKRIMRISALLLAVLLCIAPLSPFAQARASKYIASYGASMSADGYGKVSVWYDITGTGLMDEIGATVITIYENGTLVKTFQSSSTPSMLAYNKNIHGGYVSYYGVAGRTYYSYVTFWAAKQGDGDNRSYQTSSIVAT